jgi:hypothetical protein
LSFFLNQQCGSRTRQEIFERSCGEVASLRDVLGETADGRRVRLTEYVGVGVAEEAPQALAKGAIMRFKKRSAPCLAAPVQFVPETSSAV